MRVAGNRVAAVCDVDDGVGEIRQARLPNVPWRVRKRVSDVR